MNLIGTMAEMEARLVDRPRTVGQVAAYRAVLAEHPEAVVVTCADERSGCRFGNAARRHGMCKKIGGCRQPRYYQAWATWAPKDLAKVARMANKENEMKFTINSKVKLSKEAADLFAAEIARAKGQGMKYFAKAVGYPTMRFGTALEEAEKKAAKDARAEARAAGCPTMPPSIEFGELA